MRGSCGCRPGDVARAMCESPQLPNAKVNPDDRQAVATITGLGAVRWQLAAIRGKCCRVARSAIGCDCVKGRPC